MLKIGYFTLFLTAQQLENQNTMTPIWLINADTPIPTSQLKRSSTVPERLSQVFWPFATNTLPKSMYPGRCFFTLAHSR